MTRLKSHFYQIAKRTAIENGVPYPIWKTSTTAQLRSFYITQRNNKIDNLLARSMLRLRKRPFLEQIRQPQQLRQVNRVFYPYTNPETGIITYFINNLLFL